MNIVASLALLCLSAAAAVSGNESTETVLSAAPGDSVFLQCYIGANVTPVWTTWMKDGQVVAGNGGLPMGSSAANPRFALEQNGTLIISAAITEDSGSFLCSSALPDNRTINARFQLQITSFLFGMWLGTNLISLNKSLQTPNPSRHGPATEIKICHGFKE
ncbi:hypothetical protein ATANTOWER_025112 [Ataeniobius toweri]|uniref:Ig-like domain-containing protein n=1 Tax=Ataeniobius toweri TaxID=208326 RepID=A0ABU7C0X0_9TELE|nr:hypothetical protein [Ataeniobius toweri]